MTQRENFNEVDGGNAKGSGESGVERLANEAYKSIQEIFRRSPASDGGAGLNAIDLTSSSGTADLLPQVPVAAADVTAVGRMVQPLAFNGIDA